MSADTPHMVDAGAARFVGSLRGGHMKPCSIGCFNCELADAIEASAARLAAAEAELAGYKESHEKYCPSAERLTGVQETLFHAQQAVFTEGLARQKAETTLAEARELIRRMAHVGMRAEANAFLARTVPREPPA